MTIRCRAGIELCISPRCLPDAHTVKCAFHPMIGCLRKYDLPDHHNDKEGSLCPHGPDRRSGKERRGSDLGYTRHVLYNPWAKARNSSLSPRRKPQPTGPDYYHCTCNWIKTVDNKATRVFGGICEIH